MDALSTKRSHYERCFLSICISALMSWLSTSMVKSSPWGSIMRILCTPMRDWSSKTTFNMRIRRTNNSRKIGARNRIMIHNISSNQLARKIWLYGKHNSRSDKIKVTVATSLDMNRTQIKKLILNQISSPNPISTLILVISNLLKRKMFHKPRKPLAVVLPNRLAAKDK